MLVTAVFRWSTKIKNRRRKPPSPASERIADGGTTTSQHEIEHPRSAAVLEHLQTTCAILSAVADVANVPFMGGLVSAASGLVSVAQASPSPCPTRRISLLTICIKYRQYRQTILPGEHSKGISSHAEIVWRSGASLLANVLARQAQSSRNTVKAPSWSYIGECANTILSRKRVIIVIAEWSKVFLTACSLKHAEIGRLECYDIEGTRRTSRDTGLSLSMHYTNFRSVQTYRYMSSKAPDLLPSRLPFNGYTCPTKSGLNMTFKL